MSEREVPTQSIWAEEVVRELTRQRSPEEKPVYRMSAKQIEGRLDLKHRTIEVAVDIQNCEFLDEVDLRYCEFKQAVFFSDCRFRGRFDSGDASEARTVYHKDLNCMRSVFEGPFDLKGGVVEGSAYFSEAKFLNEERAIDFSWTSVGRTVEFRGTFFKGEANFNTINCGGTAHFNQATFPAKFEGEANFALATFGGNLQCQGATFAGKADFRSINCGGIATFSPAKFEGEANFGFATFGRTLTCNDATFTGPVNLQAISVSRVLQIIDASFRRDVRLYQSQIGLLNVGDALPFREHSQLDLRECRFDTFYGDLSVAREMAAKQPPEKFTRDPYLQLEKYYRGAGNDLEAKRMHYTGRNELRKNALRKGPRATNWGRFTRWGDWWIKWLTGYGVRTWLLLIYILVFLSVGTGVFWKADALLPASTQEQVAQNGAQVGETHLLSTQPEKAQEPGPLGRHLFESLVYSLDLFLPVVNLHVDENWQPNGLSRQIYAVVHSMVGWILVPLLLASLSGIIRRE